jgi:LPXTG-motif cell wall-anchored protein
MDVNGQQVSVRDLKPGMTGTATITTTTTTTPVYVTEVKEGTVMQVNGPTIIVRTPTGIKMFSEGDVSKRGVKIYKHGEPVQLADLHTGDKLSATIITEGTPKVVTERQVRASLAHPEAAGQAAMAGEQPGMPAAGAPSASAGMTGGSAAHGGRHLPKTGSQWPLVGLIGLLSLAGAVTLRTVRLRLL